MSRHVRSLSPGTLLLLAANQPENMPKLQAAVDACDGAAGDGDLNVKQQVVLQAARDYVASRREEAKQALATALHDAVAGSIDAGRRSGGWPTPDQWWQI